MYGRKWYAWARSFFNSTNKMNLLCAANQISKSSTQIRKSIEWSTNQNLWPKLWPHIWPEQENLRPIFWYTYPSAEVATIEFDMKWVPEFMPRNSYRTSDTHGWEEEKEKGMIKAIHWKNGTRIYFKLHSQNVANTQTATVHAIFNDEELPVEFYDEFAFRLAATDGYFHMVFTATLNQLLWYKAMEAKGETEAFPEAFKQTVSMYDCLVYDDGSPTPWTESRIAQMKAKCSSPAEIQRRIYGRFVTEVGRKFGAFSPEKHFIKPFEITSNYIIYGAVDIGSGGETGHPGAICFVAVRGDYKLGFVFRGWRGDGVVTTSGDLLEKFREIRGHHRPVMQIYDQQAKDFGTIASRVGESFVKAEKSHELGEDILNTLFKNNMLFIFDSAELQPLGTELIALSKLTPKQKAKDDYCDALRYAVTRIPWDFTAIKGMEEHEVKEPPPAMPLSDAEYLALEIDERRGIVKKNKDEVWADLEDDLAYWNEEYG